MGQNSIAMITSSVMVGCGWCRWHRHSEVRFGGVEGLFAQMLWGGSGNMFYYSSPVCACLFVCLWCDWLSSRHNVSQLLIREVMKGPPLWKCALCTRLIRKIFLSLERNLHSCPGLSSVGLVVQYIQWMKWTEMSQMFGAWWNWI